MKQLQLEPRLALIASLVPYGARLTDVGTDHGYLPVQLLQKGVITGAIASDIKQAPLNHARRTAAQYEMDQNIDFRLCAGLDAISPDECDTVVIAGMGGETILTILEHAPWTLDGKHTLLLQPQTKQELLRPWLVAHGGKIEQEHLVRDKGNIYAVLTVVRGTQKPLSAAQCLCGVMNQSELLYGDYASERIDKLLRAVTGLRISRRADRDVRIAEMEDIFEERRQSREAWGKNRKNPPCQPTFL